MHNEIPHIVSNTIRMFKNVMKKYYTVHQLIAFIIQHNFTEETSEETHIAQTTLVIIYNINNS